MLSRLAELTGHAARVSSAEPAALGPVIVPGLAIGSFASLDEGRAKIGGDGGRSDDETTC